MPDEPIPFAAQMGARIRTAREARGLSLDDVADRIGMSYSTVRAYETGERRVLAERIPDLCRVLRTAPTYLLGMPAETPIREEEI